MGMFMLTGNRIAGARMESEWDLENRRRAEKKSEPPVSKKTEAKKNSEPAKEKSPPAEGIGEKVCKETMRRLVKLNEERRAEAEKMCGGKKPTGLTEKENRLAEFLGVAEGAKEKSDAARISFDKNSEEKNPRPQAVFPELPLGISSDAAEGGKKSRRGRRRKNKGAENSEV